MDTVRVDILLAKGKRAAAAYVHADCSNNPSPQHLNLVLDFLLNPEKDIGEWDTIEWCKWLIAGGRTPDEFANTVRTYDNATTCGLVWTPNFVAYRCRTCGISPCMSLCTECFKKGNHQRHDFNMFLSQAGGACDCGDTSVMKETGFCDKHGPNKSSNKGKAPSDLMCVAEAMMPRIIFRLVQHLRENCRDESQDAYKRTIATAATFITMLLDFNNMGGLMRRVMCAALTNPQQYRELNEIGVVEAAAANAALAARGGVVDATARVSYAAQSQMYYEEALRSFPHPGLMAMEDEVRNCASLQEPLVHRTFLEELVFWTVKFEFPQKVVCLLLNMLPDTDYKEALTRAFVLHYSRISMMLEMSTDPDTLSNRVVHVSVQLFSNESLALRMTEHLQLLHVMVVSLKYMMSKILIQNTLHDPSNNFHYVVDCGKPVMKEHCYWPLVSDLNNVLSHKPVALKFMADDSLLEMWFTFLSMFQGMNVNQREIAQHVEFEPTTYYAAFSAELEASAYPMWALVSHLQDATTAPLTRRVLTACISALKEWLEAITNYKNTSVNDSLHSLQVSFHLPLHRYLAVFLCQAVAKQGISLNEVLPSPDTLHLLMMHPLRVQVAFYEILNGLWVRNGLQIKGQAMTYIQCNFCNSMVDADLYLLQICCTRIPAEKFLNIVIDKFHVREWMSLAPYQKFQNSFMDGEHDTPMLESFLTFLTTLISIRTNLGLSETGLNRLEMITLLCMSDKTHSQLMEMMPERCGTSQSRDFEQLLAEVADYRPPALEAMGNMQQGMYVPKADVWRLRYDPIHVLLRAVHRRDFQTSMDRYTDYARHAGKLATSTSPWPPFRTPSPCGPAYDDPRHILRSRVFHALALVVLYKALAGGVSEHEQALVIFLLEQALAVDEEREGGEREQDATSGVCTSGRHPQAYQKDMELGDWFISDCLSENLRTVIGRVILKPEPEVTPLEFSSDSELEWGEPTDPDTDMCDPVQSPMMGRLLSSVAGGTTGGSTSSSTSSSTSVPNNNMLMIEEWPGQGQPQGGGTIMDSSGVQEREGERSTEAAVPSTSSDLVPHRHPTTTTVSSSSTSSSGGSSSFDLAIMPASAGPSGTSSAASGPQQLALTAPGSDSSSLAMVEAPSGMEESGENSMALVTRQQHNAEGTEAGASSAVSLTSASAQALAARIQRAGILAGHLGRTVRARIWNKNVNVTNTTGTEVLLSRNVVDRYHHSRRRHNVDNNTYHPPTTKINESIISLLLKLHSQLSGNPDSYNPDELESRAAQDMIGDGPFYIAKLLDKIYQLDHACRDSIQETRNSLWPRRCEGEEEQKQRENKEREDRRRRAKERQQKMMAEFATKQRQFMENAMDTEPDPSDMDWTNTTGGTPGHPGHPATSTSAHTTTAEPLKQEYDCVICNQSSPSTEEKPMGCVVLVQATSVLGHRRRRAGGGGASASASGGGMERPVLPVCDEDRDELRREDTHAVEFDRRVEELDRHFCPQSWLLSVNIGWEGGVHVQTCGHHLHLDCLRAYLYALRSQQQRQQSLAPDKGEYFCPLCRQLANSVLPLAPQLGDCSQVVRSRPSSMGLVLDELSNFLRENEETPSTSNLSEAMGKAMEDMTNSTQLKPLFKPKSSDKPSHQSLFLFVTSIARTNLEVELVQRDGSLVVSGDGPPANPLLPKRDCIVPLLHVLAVHARVLALWPAWMTFQQLCGQPVANSWGAGPTSLTPVAREVPLLLRDPVALLLQFVLLLPLHLDQTYFTTVVKTIYNLVYYGVVTQISCDLSNSERERLTRHASTTHIDSLPAALRLISEPLSQTELYTMYSGGETSSSGGSKDSEEKEDGSEDGAAAAAWKSGTRKNSEGTGGVNVLALEQQVQTLCLPFLRIASLLRHHIYNTPLPDIRTAESEFVRLVYYLELVTEAMDWDRFNAAVALNWPNSTTPPTPASGGSMDVDGVAGMSDSDVANVYRTTPTSWCTQLGLFVRKSPIAARGLVMGMYVTWQPPRLLRLPREYERIFTHYHERACSQCHSVPQETSVCLLCGAVVCLKQSCCKQQNVCEAVAHSQRCGAGTAVFLVVTSTYIIVIRGRRACLWGSLYLDDFEEEDRDLKRGKPLYLSKGRYQLLEQQWLAHRFDHTKKTWVWHRDAL